MNREEAILCLKGIKNYGRDTFTEQSDWQESLDMAIKVLEQELTDIKDLWEEIERNLSITEWIPISEALPEEKELVLISTKWGDVTIAERYDGVYWYIYREFNNGCCNTETDSITAWMPLPNLYKE